MRMGERFGNGKTAPLRIGMLILVIALAPAPTFARGGRNGHLAKPTCPPTSTLGRWIAKLNNECYASHPPPKTGSVSTPNQAPQTDH